MARCSRRRQRRTSHHGTQEQHRRDQPVQGLLQQALSLTISGNVRLHGGHEPRRRRLRRRSSLRCATQATGRLRPNGHMSRSPLLVAGALELSDKMAGPLMTGHRLAALESSDSGARLGDLPARSMSTSGLVRDTFLETGGTWLKRLAPGDPLTSPGPWDLLSKIRVPVPACFPGRATRRAASVKPAARAGMGGRGLSHLQELPLISAGSRRALARTGDLRAAGVTNGQSDGGAIEPFH